MEWRELLHFTTVCDCGLATLRDRGNGQGKYVSRERRLRAIRDVLAMIKWVFVEMESRLLHSSERMEEGSE